MKHLYKITLFTALLTALYALTPTPSRAVGTLPPPPTVHTPHLFATAQNGSTVAYAWAARGAIYVTVPDGTAIYPTIDPHRPTALALVLPDPSMPVVAWRNSTGVHTAIGMSAHDPENPPAMRWLTTNYGAGRNPQLLTSPLRLVYFDSHGAFTCQQWSGTQWQHGCEA